MEYLYAQTPQLPADRIIAAIQGKLSQRQKVLWLISGGSVVDVAVQAAKQLEDQPLLKIMQIDERYGPVGHADSNWQHLIQKGMNIGAFHYSPVLTGKDIEQTTDEYDALLTSELEDADFVIGLFGIGVDGHTAGMLPGSVAVTEERRMVVSYEGDDFKRITVAMPFFAHVDMAVVLALGEAKINALLMLQQDLAVTDQPAQALKKAEKLYVYTDNKGVIT
jgi:6-phosphogluconolactonase/glucosamine-6-phosphate isomerase/deaminase